MPIDERLALSDPQLDPAIDQAAEVSPTPESRTSLVMTGLRELLKTGLLALVVFLGARLLILPYQVDGRSMDPSLHDQERVLVNRALYARLNLDVLVGWVPGVDVDEGTVYAFHPPRRGDVVVLNPPQYSAEPYIKRVVALAGDRVDFRDGYVLIDGERLPETYLDGHITDCDGPDYCDGFTVPEGTVFVLGDNRDASLDSRVFGPVPLTHIVGKAWLVNWPLSAAGLIPDD